MPLSGYGEGKLAGFSRGDFSSAMRAAGIAEKICDRILNHFIACREKWFQLIDDSLLRDPLKTAYKSLIDNRLSRL